MLIDSLTGPLSDVAAAVKVLTRAGLVSPVRPDRLIGMTASFRHWGMSPAAMYAKAGLDAKGIVATAFEALVQNLRGEAVKMGRG